MYRPVINVSAVRIIEDSYHDFRIKAVIFGKVRKYIAGRTSDLAADIVRNGRRKISANDVKALVERLLMPLERMDAALSSPVCGGLR